MIELLCLAVYIVGLVMTKALITRLLPHWWHDEVNARWVPSRSEGKDFGAFVGPLFWPVTWVIAFASLAGAASLQSVNEKTKLRSELEAELAKAKKEIDDLLAR